MIVSASLPGERSKERPHPRKTMKTANSNIVLIIFLLMYEILSKLFVNRWPQARNRDFPSRKEFRNSQGIPISQGHYLRNRFSAIPICTKTTGAVDRDDMGIRINENAYLYTLT